MRRIDILAPTLGVYLDRPAYAIPPRALSDGRNCRIVDGAITRDLMGWDPFFDVVLNGPVTLIHTFRTRSGARTLILGTPTDLYRWDPVGQSVEYITPRYETGTAQVTVDQVSVFGVGTSWLANVNPGDEICFDNSGITDPDATWHLIESVDADNFLTLAELTDPTGLQPYTIRKKFTATRLDPWISTAYYGAPAPDTDIWFATNGVDAPVKWNGSDDQVELLTALNFTCRWLLAFNGMMIYGNLLESGDRRADVLRFSAIGEPENVTTNGAGEVNGTTSRDILVGADVLGDFVVTVGQYGSLNILQFVGGEIGFVVRTPSTRHGSVSGRSLVNRGDFIEVMGIDGPYRFDGATVSPMGEHVFRSVVRSLDPNRHAQALSYMDRENGEIHWVLPLVSDGSADTANPVTAWTEFYREDVGRAPTPWIPRDLPATAIGDYERDDTLRFSDIVAEFRSVQMRWSDRFLQATFPQKLVGFADGTVHTLGSSDAHNGAAISSYARFGRVALGDGTNRGLLSRIEFAARLVADAEYPLTVRVLEADRAETPGAEAASLEYDLGEAGPRWLAPRVLARFADIEIRTDGAHEPWSVSGLRLHTQLAGER